MVNEPEPEPPQQQQDLSSGIHGNTSQAQVQPPNPNIANPTPTTSQPIQPQQLFRANQSQDQLHQLQNQLQKRLQRNPPQNLIAPPNTVSHGTPALTPAATLNPQRQQTRQLQAQLQQLQQRLQRNRQQSLIAPSNRVSQGLPAGSQAPFQQLQQQSRAQQLDQLLDQQLQSLIQIPLNPQQNLPSNSNAVSQGVRPILYYLPTGTSTPQQVHQSQTQLQQLQQQSQTQLQQLQQQSQTQLQQQSQTQMLQHLQQQSQNLVQQLQQPLQLQSLLTLNPQQNPPSNAVSQGQRPIRYLSTATSSPQQDELLDGMNSIPENALPPPIVPKAAPPTLPNWEVSSRAAVSALTPFIREHVNPQSAEHTVLLELFPSHQFRVNKIERVVNNGLWRKFQSHRRCLLVSKSADFELLSGLGLTDTELQQQAHVFLNVNLPAGIPAYSDNVALLFHGTRGNIDDVLRQGLDERLAGGGLCGRGIYFSDDPAKSAGYAAHGVLFLCAVMLGDCASTPVSYSAVREPEKVPAQRRNHEDNFYDSVVSRPINVNEFIIYNRYQCVPLYEIHYTKLLDATLLPAELSANGLMYKLARDKLPPFAWTRFRMENRVLRPDEANRWPFFAQSLIARMENFESESPPNSREAKKMRTGTEVKAPNEGYHTQFNLPASLFCARDCSTSTSGPSSSSTKEKRVNAVLGANSSAIQPTEHVKVADSNNGAHEECRICCCPMTPATCATLDCCAQDICKDCYSKLEVTRQTMSKQTFTFLKCPYCGECSGTQIGTCPDGDMRTEFLPEDLSGYEDSGTIQITYDVNHGRYSANRVAYLPSTQEGLRIVMLLSIAWDRRHVFTIGDSLTRLQSDVLIWNIHHKTAKMGGVSAYGYPDPTYLTRVADELKQYGIQ